MAKRSTSTVQTVFPLQPAPASAVPAAVLAVLPVPIVAVVVVAVVDLVDPVVPDVVRVAAEVADPSKAPATVESREAAHPARPFSFCGWAYLLGGGAGHQCFLRMAVSPTKNPLSRRGLKPIER